MPLTLSEISRLSRAVVASYCADRVGVDGVTHTAPDSEYAEVLLTVMPLGPEDRRGPRTLLVQVRRSDAATLEHDLLRRLARALRARPTTP
jgi:hypothetical protein